MPSPRIPLTALVSIAVVLVGGCGTDAKKSTAKSTSASTTTTAAGPSATAGPATTTTTATTTTVSPAATTTRVTLPPVDDNTFDGTINKVNAALDAAGTDTCKIIAALPNNFPSAGTVAQAKQQIALMSRLFAALGNSLPAEQKLDADALKAAATSVTDEATALKFDPKLILDGSRLTTFQGHPFGTAMKDVSEACAKK